MNTSITDYLYKFFITFAIVIFVVCITSIIPYSHERIYLYNVNESQKITGGPFVTSSENTISYWEKRGDQVVNNVISLENSEIYEDEETEPYAIIDYNIFNEPILAEFHLPKGTIKNSYDLE